MSIGNFGFHQVVGGHLIIRLISVKPYRLNTEHNGKLLVQGIKVEQLPDTGIYLIFGNDLLAERGFLRQAAGIFLGGQNIAVIDMLQGEIQRETIALAHCRDILE